MTNRFRLVLTAGFIAATAAVAVPVLRAQDGPGRGFGPGSHFGGPMQGGPGDPGGRMGPGGGPMGMPGGLGRGLRALDLSPDQRAQVRTILDGHKAGFQPLRERMRAAREGMRALVEADKAQEVAAVEADLAILGAKVRGEVFAMLTPEQQEKAKALPRHPGRR